MYAHTYSDFPKKKKACIYSLQCNTPNNKNSPAAKIYKRCGICQWQNLWITLQFILAPSTLLWKLAAAFSFLVFCTETQFYNAFLCACLFNRVHFCYYVHCAFWQVNGSIWALKVALTAEKNGQNEFMLRKNNESNRCWIFAFGSQSHFAKYWQPSSNVIKLISSFWLLQPYIKIKITIKGYICWESICRCVVTL